MDSSDDQALVFRSGNRFLKQAHTDPTSFTQGPREHATAFVFTGVQTMVPSSAPLPSLFHPGQFSILYGEWLQVLHSPGLLWSGQGMERTQFSPPSFANHSSVYAPLDYFSVLEKYLSFYMLHGHFTLSMSLKFAPPNQTPLQLHAQARYLGMDWTASPTHPQILDSSLIIPGTYFLPSSIPVSSPISSCLDDDVQATERSHHCFTLPWLHCSWDKDTTFHYG